MFLQHSVVGGGGYWGSHGPPSLPPVWYVGDSPGKDRQGGPKEGLVRKEPPPNSQSTISPGGGGGAVVGMAL